MAYQVLPCVGVSFIGFVVSAGLITSQNTARNLYWCVLRAQQSRLAGYFFVPMASVCYVLISERVSEAVLLKGQMC